MDKKTKMCLTKWWKTESEKSGLKSEKQKYFRAFCKNMYRLSFFSQIEKGVIPLKRKKRFCRLPYIETIFSYSIKMIILELTKKLFLFHIVLVWEFFSPAVIWKPNVTFSFFLHMLLQDMYSPPKYKNRPTKSFFCF